MRIPMEGKVYNNWYVDSYLGEGMYLCKCRCGTVRQSDGHKIRTGSSKSCGCRVKEPAKTKVIRRPFKPEDKYE